MANELSWYTKEGSSYPGKIDPAFINAINYAGGLEIGRAHV